MAEDDGPGGGGGGGALSGTVKLPVIGPAKKKVVAIVGGLAGTFVLWRYWQARQAGATTAADAGTDSNGDGYADAGTLPSVSGAVSGTNSYGLADGSSTGTDTYGFTGTTNSQWTQYASTQLSAASDKWSYGDIVEALGAFVLNRPLTTTQQAIVQAAIGLTGQPPEGTHPIIPGGDVPMTVAPSGLTVTATTPTTVTLSWAAVAGAASYRAYRSGASTNIGTATGTTITISGLTPNTSYTFYVAAATAAGQLGPRSAGKTGKTKPVTLAKPTGLRASSVTKSSAVASCKAVPGATGYLWYINGVSHGHSDHPQYTVTALKANTSYKLKVAADTATQSQGPASGEITFKTKAK